MKYSYEFKLDAVYLYRQGKGIDTPEWITNEKNFRNMIVRWSHLEEHNGPEVLRHKSCTC